MSWHRVRLTCLPPPIAATEMRMAKLMGFKQMAMKVLDVSLASELAVGRELMQLAGGPSQVSKKVETLKFVLGHEVNKAMEMVYDEAVMAEMKFLEAKRKMTPKQKRKLEERSRVNWLRLPKLKLQTDRDYN